MNLLKKLLTLFFMYFSLITNVFSQQDQPIWQQSDIMGKDWHFYNEGNYSIVLNFSNTEKTEISPLGQTIKSYYLSESIETTFDWTKVGNVSSGRYIIILWSPANDKRAQPHIGVYEILYLDEHTLQIKYSPHLALVGSGISTWRSPQTDWVDPYDYDNPYDYEDQVPGGWGGNPE